MKILLTGKNGQVGFELRRSLAVLGEVHAVGSAECDLRDETVVRGLVQTLRPDVIVNSAAYTAVDKAEGNSAEAEAVNALAPRLLGEEAQRLGAMLVHYSTDYVFDGTKDGTYFESDRANPQSVYGLTKLAGEQAVQFACERHLILRTSWVVGAHGANFAKTMLRLATEREALNVVTDQHGTPTSAPLLADVTAHLIRQAAAGKASFNAWGIYHATASGSTAWYDYACHVIEFARASGKPIRVSPGAIYPVTTTDYPTPAKRPANSRLNTSKLTKTFGLRLPPWQEGVNQVLNQLLNRSAS